MSQPDSKEPVKNHTLQMNTLTLASRTISSTTPPFVIAEIGVNHDGALHLALELVSHAQAAGADAVKLQIFTARNLMHESTSFASYQSDRCQEATPTEMLQ